MNLVLCGMMGCGKTTVGRLLAKSLQWEWADTDEYIVSRYGDISGIFEKKGVSHFRELETEAVKMLTQKDRLVISTGGGILLRKENISLLKKNGRMIYLRAKKETLAARLQDNDSRPLLQTKESLDEKLTRLLEERAGLYEGAADVVVDVDAKAPEEIVKEILARMEIK